MIAQQSFLNKIVVGCAILTVLSLELGWIITTIFLLVGSIVVKFYLNQFQLHYYLN